MKPAKPSAECAEICCIKYTQSGLTAQLGFQGKVEPRGTNTKLLPLDQLMYLSDISELINKVKINRADKKSKILYPDITDSD